MLPAVPAAVPAFVASVAVLALASEGRDAVVKLLAAETLVVARPVAGTAAVVHAFAALA